MEGGPFSDLTGIFYMGFPYFAESSSSIILLILCCVIIVSLTICANVTNGMYKIEHFPDYTFCQVSFDRI